MPHEPVEVNRRQVRFLPVSTTEVNVSRLPVAESLKGMELAYREEPRTDTVSGQVIVWWGLSFVAFGFLYTWAWLQAPGLVSIGWRQIQAEEGFSVVALMLLLLIGLCGSLTVCFLIPPELRLIIVCISGPAAFASVTWLKHPEAIVFLSLVLTGVYAYKLRRGVLWFHHEWLLSDPRMNRARQAAWLSSSGNPGWIWPGLDEEAVQVLRRYLTYHAAPSGAAGVWIPSQSNSYRLMLVSLTGSSAFVLWASIVLISVPSKGIGLLLGMTGAALLLIAIATLFLGRAAALSRFCEEHLSSDRRTWWEQNVDRLRQSEHVTKDQISGAALREAEHLFLGVEPWLNFPILIHESILHEHTYIVGRSGSGKTSIGMMQLMMQVIRGHCVIPASLSGLNKNNTSQDVPAHKSIDKENKLTWSDPTPVVVIDLKGDPVMFQTAKAEAENRGQKFRFFTLEKGKSSCWFNPFSGFYSGSRSLPQLVQLVLDSLGLNHGEGYGRSYYSQRSRFMLSEVLRTAKGINNFKDLYKSVQELYRERKTDFRDAFELVSIIESLTHYDKLVTTKAQDANTTADTIQLDRVLENREVVYFWLPSALESVSVREVGKLVLFNLRTAAMNRKDTGKELRRAFLFIDECQKLAGENFQEVLQQARSGGISVVLANQSLSDLRTTDLDLRPTVLTNTRMKMYYSTSELEEIQMISEFSGQILQASPDEETEVPRPRLTTQEVLAISDHPQRLFLHVNGGGGYTQFGGLPIPVQTDWPISKSLADVREKLPWPTLPPAPQCAVDVNLVPPARVNDNARIAVKKKYQKQLETFLDQ